MESTQVMDILGRRKWAILLTGLVCALLTATAAWRMGHEYTASVTLKVDAAALVAPVERVAPGTDDVEETPLPEAQQAQTQAMLKTVDALVKSPGVLSPVIGQLQLRESLAALQGRIAVKELSPVLLELTVSDSNPLGATQLAGAVADSFIRFSAESRAAEARRAREALAPEVQRARQAVAAAARQTGADARPQMDAANAAYASVYRRSARLEAAETLLRQGGVAQVLAGAGPANPPADTSRGRTLKLALAGLLLGTLAAATVAVALEAFDRRVRTLADAEALFAEPVLAVVPRAPASWEKAAVARATGEHPTSPVAEAFHLLALRVLRHPEADGCLALAGLAARPQQGVTTTLTNLAIALAQAGKRVVLVDADLRQPSLHEVFGLPVGPGLAALPAGAADLARGTSVANLRLVSAGSDAANPWEVLRSDAFASFLQALRGGADFIILNTPPAVDAADALSVATSADAALVVFRASQVPSAAEVGLRESLREAGVPLLGVVLNDVRPAQLAVLRSQLGRAGETPREAARQTWAECEGAAAG